MNDLEIEKAAMGPRRWIEFCGGFEKQYFNDPRPTLHPRATRTIDSLATKVKHYNYGFFIVPGGRYVVGHSSGSDDNISILDLGYTSSADCRLIASVGGEDVYLRWSQFRVQTTPDGMGLTIYSATM